MAGDGAGFRVRGQDLPRVLFFFAAVFFAGAFFFAVAFFAGAGFSPAAGASPTAAISSCSALGMRETRSTGCLVRMFPFAPLPLTARSPNRQSI
jgi:hypothetical protein